MGKTKQPWWNYVKTIIRDYPQLKKEIDTPLEQSVSSKIVGGGGSGGVSKPVENCVIHDLSPKKQKRYDAVNSAIETTKSKHPYDYVTRLKIVELVYFQKSHTILGASIMVNCSANTAGTWQADFIKTVAEKLDLV